MRGERGEGRKIIYSCYVYVITGPILHIKYCSMECVFILSLYAHLPPESSFLVCMPISPLNLLLYKAVYCAVCAVDFYFEILYLLNS